MKLSFFFAFLLFNFAQSQNLKVEYSRLNNRDIDYSNSEISSDDFKNKISKELEKGQKNILYILNGNSFFKSIPRGSIITEEEGNRVDNRTTTRNRNEFIDTQMKIYNKKGDKGFYQYHNFDDDEMYHYSIPKFDNIEYKEDVEYIENYKCKLAEVSVMGNINKIWYTEDIPVSAGPYVFNNLPGLVLKIENSNFIIYATKVSNEGKKEDFENINPKLKVLNDEEFMKRRSEYQTEKSKVKEDRKTIRL